MDQSRVFRVSCDVKRYPRFSCRIEGDLAQSFRVRRGLSLEHWWVAPRIHVNSNNAWRPDIWQLSDPKPILIAFCAAEKLMPYAAMAGELVPLRTATAEGESVALSVENVVDALRASKRVVPHGVINPDFIAHRLGEPTLFVVPQLRRTVFCLERSDAEDSFMRRIRRHKLTGLAFEEVWSRETGAHDINLAAESAAP
jgi:hypothetical protein